jgi:cytochrome c oxidase subunit 2
MSLPVPPTAVDYWDLFSAFFIIGLVAGGIVVSAMVYYAYVNRRKIGRREFKISRAHFRSRARETVILAMISLTILFSLSVLSDRIAANIQTPPETSTSLVINVNAFQWAFQFIYPNNVTVATDCRIPVNTTVIFNVTSLDVMHDFGLPQFKIKTDAIPGRHNIIWINVPSLEGQNELTYQIKCYELCGIGHTFMMGNLIVMNQTAFDQWLNQTAVSQGLG